MKTKLVLTILGFSFFFSCSVLGQNAPNFKVLDNKFSSINMKKIDGKYYETLNYIDFKRKETEIDTLKAQIRRIFSQIQVTYPQDDLHLRTQLKNKEDELKESEMAKDLFWNEYVKDYLEINNWTTGFWESRSRALFDLMYHENTDDRFYFLTNTGFNIGNNTGSIYSELVNGHMYIFRVSLGAMVASSSSTETSVATEEEAFQRLTTYGGNTVLTLEYPLIYAHTDNNQAILLTRFLTKGTADFPAFGTTSDEWAGSLSYGLDIYGDISTSNNEIRFFGNFNISQFMGTSTFKENLNISNDSFSFGQLKLGVMFSKVSLSFVVATFSSEENLRNRNVIAGGQVLH